MQPTQEYIADKFRGVAAERRFTHNDIANILGLSRPTVSLRMNGRMPFTGVDLVRMSEAAGVPVTRFFPDSSA